MGLGFFDLGLPQRSAQTIVTAPIGLLIELKSASQLQHEMQANVASGSRAVILKVDNDFRSSPKQRTCGHCFGMSFRANRGHRTGSVEE
jgi:hypothetical protein